MIDDFDRQNLQKLKMAIGRTVTGLSGFELETREPSSFAEKGPSLLETYWPVRIHFDDSQCLEFYSEVSNAVRLTVEEVEETYPPTVVVSGTVASDRAAIGEVSLLEVKNTPWASGFVLDHGQFLGVALGETAFGDTIDFIPDSFVVISDRRIAASRKSGRSMGTGVALIQRVSDGWLRQAEAQLPDRSFLSSSKDDRWCAQMTIRTDRRHEPT